MLENIKAIENQATEDNYPMWGNGENTTPPSTTTFEADVQQGRGDGVIGGYKALIPFIGYKCKFTVERLEKSEPK